MPLDAEPEILSDGARALWVADLDEHGLSCVCGTEATNVETDMFAQHVATALEPGPWLCEACADEVAVPACPDCASGVVHEPGTADCPMEVGR